MTWSGALSDHVDVEFLGAVAPNDATALEVIRSSG
jgi:hypothetical protein